MRHFIDFDWKTADAPCISVLYPNQIHMLELSKDAETDLILFNNSVYCSDILNGELRDYNIDLKKRLNFLTGFSEEDWKVITALSEHLKFLCSDGSLIKKEQVKLFIQALLLKLIDFAPLAYPIQELDRDLKYYQKFIDAIGKDFVAQKKVQDYSKELKVSTKKLSLVCKKYSGHTPLELIHERLSLELKRMIVEDGLMLKEIARKLDFSSQPALNKFIERQFGSTPQRWKESLEESMSQRMVDK